MSLQKELTAFARAAPNGRPALYEAKLKDLRATPSIEPTSIALALRANFVASTACGNHSKRSVDISCTTLAVTIFSDWFVFTRFSVSRELRIWRMPVVLLAAVSFSFKSTAQAATFASTLMQLAAGILACTFVRQRQGGKRRYVAIVAGMCLLALATIATHEHPSLEGLDALAIVEAASAPYALLFGNSGLTSIELTALTCICSVVLFPLAVLDLILLDHASAAEITRQGLYQGVLMCGVAIFIFNRFASLRDSATATAIIRSAAWLLAIPVLGEMPLGVEFAAIAIFVAGVLLVSRRPATTYRIQTQERVP